MVMVFIQSYGGKNRGEPGNKYPVFDFRPIDFDFCAVEHIPSLRLSGVRNGYICMILHIYIYSE